MAHSDETTTANALRSVIAGLAEDIIDEVAAADASHAGASIGKFNRLAAAGRDITLAADAARMLPDRAS